MDGTASSTSFEERVFEVEKLGDTGVYSQLYLNELEDGPGWFESRTGRALINGLEDVQLPVGWKWTSNWKLNTPGGTTSATEDGWAVEKQLRRRRWFRRRERIGASSSASTHTTSSATARKTVEGGGAVTTEALQRLEECELRLKAATGKRTVETIMREGREAVVDCQRGLAVCQSAAVKIKITNDLSTSQRRFELALQEALARTSGGSSLRRANSSSVAAAAAALQEDGREEEEEEQELRQQQQLQQQQQQQQRQQILSHQVEANSMRIEERHKEVVKIHHMTHQVNDMMRDLAAMVAEQGDDIRTIKTATATTRDNVSAGLAQVEKAEQYQKDGGTCVTM